MSAVMIDNWSIEAALAYVTNSDSVIYTLGYANSYKNDFPDVATSWYNFLMAVILWDEIWYYYHPLFSSWKHLHDDARENNKYRFLFDEILYPINGTLINDDIKDIFDDENWIRSQIDNSEVLYFDNITDGAVKYRLLSNILGINLLLYPKRMYKENIKKKTKELFSRIDVLSKADKELHDYYLFVNKELGRNFLEFEHPVLYDYIRQNSKNEMDELQAALSLRNNPDIRQFRDEMYEIELRINNGNTQLLLAQLKVVSDIAKEISSKYNKQINIGEIKISLTPSISKTIPLKIKCSSDMKIHTTFIKEIIDFGVYRRKMLY